MKAFRWPGTILLLLLGTSEIHGQFFGPGYGYGGGLGFGIHGRHFSLGGFAGYSGFGYGPFGFGPFGYGFGPYGIVSNRVSVNYITPTVVIPPPRRGLLGPSQDDDDDIRGVDLDLVPPKKPSPPEPPDLPGVDVSKPKKVVRPGKEEPKVKVPPVKPPEPPPELPPPKDDPIEEAVRLVDLGVKEFHQGFYGLAGFRFGQAVGVDPKNARGHFFLAQAQFAMARYTDAVESIQAGMRLMPGWPDVKFNPRLDLYKGHEADFDQHLKRLQKALEANPKNADYLFLLGHQTWFDGRRGPAVDLFRRARKLTLDPTFIDAFLRAAGPGPLAAK